MNEVQLYEYLIYYQAFKETKSGIKPAGVWKTLVGVINPVTSTNCIQNCKLTIGVSYSLPEKVLTLALNEKFYCK